MIKMNWENILKKDSSLTDEQQKRLEEILEETRQAINKVDLKTLNWMFSPNGRNKYSSKEELMAVMEKRIKTALKAKLLKSDIVKRGELPGDNKFNRLRSELQANGNSPEGKTEILLGLFEQMGILDGNMNPFEAARRALNEISYLIKEEEIGLLIDETEMGV